MATLSTTLAGARENKPSYNYSYQPPRMPSPYPNYPPMPSVPQNSMPSGQNSGLYQAILGRTSQQAERVLPSTKFGQPMSFDPIMQRIAAMPSMNETNAAAENQALRKRAIIESGMADVGQEIGLDQQTLEAARLNPDSGKELLARDYSMRGRERDEALNTGNLFFSGFRQRQMEDMEANRRKAETDFVTSLRDALMQSQNMYLAVQEREKQAAAQAALDNVLSGTPPGGAPPGTGGPPVVVPGPASQPAIDESVTASALPPVQEALVHAPLSGGVMYPDFQDLVMGGANRLRV